MPYKTACSLIACVVLAACAAYPQAPLESRLASWSGASSEALIAALGRPTSSSETHLEWRQQSSGLASAASPTRISTPTDRLLTMSPSGQSTSHGIEGKSWTETGSSQIAPRECVYVARLDGDKIVSVVTDVVSGRCRFDDLPLRSLD